jgi:hypothetical protein
MLRSRDRNIKTLQKDYNLTRNIIKKLMMSSKCKLIKSILLLKKDESCNNDSDCI